MKKIGLLFTTVLMIMLFALSASALEPTGQCGENVYWNYDNQTKNLIITGTGDMDDYAYWGSPFETSEIDKVIICDGVTSIGKYAFAHNTYIKSIIIPNSVTNIGSGAFESCYKLANIIVDDNNEFYSSDEFGVLFNKNKTDLIKYPIGNTRDEYIIPNGVTNVGDYAFSYCSYLSKLTIPASLTYFGYECFYRTKLASISVDENSQFYTNDEFGVLFNKEETNLIQYPTGSKRTEYVIPNGVTKIYDDAFFESDNLTSIIIPDSVTSIGYHSFGNCSKLKSIVIPDSVIDLQRTAFEGTAYYHNKENWKDGLIYVGNHLIGIGYDTAPTMKNFIIRDGTITIAGGAFVYNKQIESIVIPDSVNYIGSFAFDGCNNLINIEFGNGLNIIDDYAFRNCKALTSITLNEGLTTIGQQAFASCDSLAKVVIPDGVTSIEEAAFLGCTKLTNITIPDGITNIGESMFFLCNNLTSIVLPNSINNIGYAAFEYCDSLSDVYYDGYEEEWQQINIGNYNKELTNANIHFKHRHIYDAIVTAPTCTSQGFTTYACECGDTYIEDYVDANGHNHTSEITTPATHLTEGVMTYTCYCGDIYTEVIAKTIEHSHVAVVTAPTCTAQGYTTYTCECGDSYVDNYADANGHSYTSEVTTQPTHLAEGIKTFTCSCGDTYTESVVKLSEHTYISNVTKEPTHKEEGIKTFICECGDTYTEPIDKIPHSYKSVVTAPTCSTQGCTIYTCECGDSYTGDYVNALGHKLGEFVITKEGTCTVKGEKEAGCTRCDYIETKEYTQIVHKDENADGYCEECNEYIPAEDCFCPCHAKTIGAFIYKLFTVLDKLFGTRLLNKVFNITEICSCGLKH